MTMEKDDEMKPQAQREQGGSETGELGSRTLAHAQVKRLMKDVTGKNTAKNSITLVSKLAEEYIQELTRIAAEDPEDTRTIMPRQIQRAHERYQNKIVKDKFEPQARELKETSEKVIETLKWLR